MLRNSLIFAMGAAFAAVIGCLTIATPAYAGSEEVVHNFNASNNGATDPGSGVIFDPAGNMYGITEGGGLHLLGTVYELSPAADGSWSGKILHAFGAEGDGAEPASPLTMDASGNLYGTTLFGGPKGQGAVFQLVHDPNGTWTEKILHSFAGGTDGYYPQGKLAIDASGNVYGTTVYGGTHGRTCDSRACGIAFELTPGADGAWSETILHSFQNTKTDGGYPDVGITLDASGNLYGTTETGGRDNGGTVFQITSSNGVWTETTLYNFCSQVNCTDGGLSLSTLIFDPAGNLYGTNANGGANLSQCGDGVGCGNVFELSPGANGLWTYSILYNFCAQAKCADGTNPGVANLIFDANGNLFGTASKGGIKGTNCTTGCGTVYELSPVTGAGWTETTLYSFTPNAKNGVGINGGVVFDAAGNLYGTTSYGGAYSDGTIFTVIP